MIIRAFPLIALLLLGACQTVPVTPRPAFTERQVAVLKGNGFEPVGDGWQFGMADRLLFASDESRLIAAQQGVIARMAQGFVAVDITGARVEGHTDSTGAIAYNEALSQKRAQAVADALTMGGMQSAAIRVVGMGARAPVESNRSRQGRQENRRVVIIVSPADVTMP